ncbi:lipase member H isoform X1 [Leptinotarsa decemlineata]|uniref:lipase member H isoform X1 n=1 Tax=Leptinotarsa decemlineata TaxID=7539 RepID=UPI003D30B7AA
MQLQFQLLLEMNVIVPILCLLYRQSGPLSIVIQKGRYQLYPINKRICSEFDPYRDTIFELYTRKNPLSPQILIPQDEMSIKSSNINFSNPTVFFSHGFLESSRSDDAVYMRDKHLLLGDYNIILVNSERLLAGPFYVTSALNCLPIGKYCAKFVDFLVSLGLQLKNVQIIGQSLGAHIAGITGKYITTGKVSRITGLDPAGPYFSLVGADEKIGKEDGYFVDIVHTNAGAFGLKENLGTVDIWVNGGSHQPACDVLKIIKRAPGNIPELVFCNHYQAYRMYVMTLVDPKSYPITECSTHKDFEKSFCDSNGKSYMGIDINRTVSGNYFVDTGVTAAEF